MTAEPKSHNLRRCLPLACGIVSALLSMAAMTACKSPGPTVGTHLKMACVPDALLMKSALQRAGVDSKVLALRYLENGRKIGHAVLLFCLGDKLYAWDSTWGSIPIGPADNYSLSAAKLANIYLRSKVGSRNRYLLTAWSVPGEEVHEPYAGP